MCVLWDWDLCKDVFTNYSSLRLGGAGARGPYGCDSKSHGESLPTCLV